MTWHRKVSQLFLDCNKRGKVFKNFYQACKYESRIGTFLTLVVNVRTKKMNEWRHSLTFKLIPKLLTWNNPVLHQPHLSPALNMSSFVLEKFPLRTSLMFYCYVKHSTADSYRILMKPTANIILWNYNDFCSVIIQKRLFVDLQNEERRSTPIKFWKWRAACILERRKPTSTRKAIEPIKGHFGSNLYTLKGDGKYLYGEEMGPAYTRRETTEKLEDILQNATYPVTKSERFFHRVLTSDKKWIYPENLTHGKSWLSTYESSKSTARANCFGRKAVFCVWWDTKVEIFFELLKQGKTVAYEHWKPQITNLDPIIELWGISV